MADPNSIADIVSVQVQFLPVTAIGRFGFANPTVVAEFASSLSFSGRIKAYTGTSTQKLAALAADGFATTSETYRQVRTTNIQDGPPRTIYVGRKDAGDADWGVALQAIKAAADVAGLSFYAFTAATRDSLEIEAIADYLEGVPDAQVFAFYLAQTDDLNVFNNTVGNVAANILAKDYKKTALLWHDPETASGYGPAILQSTVGPFNIPNGATILLRVDGGATQAFAFAAAAATLLGSIVETFAFADGDELLLATNGGAVQTVPFSVSAATVLSSLAETYAFTNGMVLSVRVDGGAASAATFNGTAGAVPTVGGDPFALADLETVTFAIDGGANQVVTFNAADFVSIGAATAEELADVYTAALTGVTVSHDGSNVTVTSNRLGTSSDVRIVAATGGVLVALGYSVGNNTGTGFAAFLDVATAAEVATEIAADIAGLTAADDGGFVRLTSQLVGSLSRVQVTGGTANAVLGFDTNEAAGAGDFADASAATALEVVTVINANATGVIASVDTAAVRLTSTVLGTSSAIDVDASAVATALGLSLTAVAGTGDFANAATATPAEVALVISATLTGAVASSASSRVLVTSSTSGTASTVQAVGGTLLNTLRFVDSVTAVSNLATGTGVVEDFADCAWMGRCITFDLDAPSGAALWVKQTLKAIAPSGSGTVPMLGDKFNPLTAETDRDRLHNTLFVNTYEERFGRNETHRGSLLNSGMGAGGYIDVRTTLDWLAVRIAEDFNAALNAAADAKTKFDYSDQSGVGALDGILRARLQTADTNGHTFYDDSPLDLDNEQDTGIFTPTVAGQTQADINARFLSGFQATQQIRGGVQGARVIVNLTGPLAAQ